jgi:biopolymer transport protein ExbD
MGIRTRNKVSVEFSMASMTDIVFLLLIFFIIVSTMVTPYALNVNLPNSKNKSAEKAKVSVSIEKNLNFSINGKLVPKESLELELKSKLENTEKPMIMLFVDKEVPTGESIYVLDIANRNKYGIVLATQP